LHSSCGFHEISKTRESAAPSSLLSFWQSLSTYYSLVIDPSAMLNFCASMDRQSCLAAHSLDAQLSRAAGHRASAHAYASVLEAVPLAFDVRLGRESDLKKENKNAWLARGKMTFHPQKVRGPDLKSSLLSAGRVAPFLGCHPPHPNSYS
jgi:hypothetical protein